MKCYAPEFRLGNGVCNRGAANTEQCGWDGGDCCYLSCIQNPDPSKASNCGVVGYDCQDPSMLHPTSVSTSLFSLREQPGSLISSFSQKSTCAISTLKLGDGHCDKGPANSEECGWDEGDCCESTCLGNRDSDAAAKCGTNGYECLDPGIKDAFKNTKNLRGNL